VTEGVEAYARYRAPAESGKKLAVPPWSEIGGLVSANIAWRQRQEIELAGRPLSDLTREARREALAAASPARPNKGQATATLPDLQGQLAPGPFSVTGHQPGLAHPGVWWKNFAAAELARRHGGVGVHLVIDADVCRNPAILVPAGSVDAPRQAVVEFDAPAQVIPWEERRVADDDLWRAFPERVHRAAGQLLDHPLIDAWWPTVLAASASTPLIGAALTQARHAAEAQWGCGLQELPQSRLCQSSAFRWFAATLLCELPRLASAYNGALDAYRRTHRIRNHAHPVPNLANDAGWQEAPFWIWTSAEPRRRPLFVRSAAGGLIVSDRGRWERRVALSHSLDASAVACDMADWEAAGVKLRSRALITTMFTRLAVADVFIHGIGGAKYDEATDAICERFFGVAPPAFATLSGTLRLPIAHQYGQRGDVRQLRAELRELKFHPERRLDFADLPAGPRREAELIAKEKARWIAMPKSPATAADRHSAIVAANGALANIVSADRARVEREIAEADRAARARRVLDARDYAFCLFPPKLLEQFLLDFSAEAL
jgi:hypothetical protein